MTLFRPRAEKTYRVEKSINTYPKIIYIHVYDVADFPAHHVIQYLCKPISLLFSMFMCFAFVCFIAFSK